MPEMSVEVPRELLEDLDILEEIDARHGRLENE